MARGMGRRLFAGQLKTFARPLGWSRFFCPLPGQQQTTVAASTAAPVPAAAVSRRLRAPSFPLGGKRAGGDWGDTRRGKHRDFSTAAPTRAPSGGRKAADAALWAAPRPPPDEAPRRAFGPGAAGGARADAPPLADGERGGPRGKRRHRARGRRSREDGAGNTHRQAPLARSAPAGLTGRLWRPGQRRTCGAFAASIRKAARGGAARTESRAAAAGGDEPG